MADTEKDRVVLYAQVKESTRLRLKLAAVQRGITMGELLDEILDRALPKVDNSGSK